MAQFQSLLVVLFILARAVTVSAQDGGAVADLVRSERYDDLVKLLTTDDASVVEEYVGVVLAMPRAERDRCLVDVLGHSALRTHNPIADPSFVTGLYRFYASGIRQPGLCIRYMENTARGHLPPAVERDLGSRVVRSLDKLHYFDATRPKPPAEASEDALSGAWMEQGDPCQLIRVLGSGHSKESMQLLRSIEQVELVARDPCTPVRESARLALARRGDEAATEYYRAAFLDCLAPEKWAAEPFHACYRYFDLVSKLRYIGTPAAILCLLRGVAAPDGLFQLESDNFVLNVWTQCWPKSLISVVAGDLNPPADDDQKAVQTWLAANLPELEKRLRARDWDLPGLYAVMRNDLPDCAKP